MDDLISLVVIVAGVVGWLYSLFKNDQGKKPEKRLSQPKQTTNPTTNSSSIEKGTEPNRDLQTYAERQRERYRDLQSGKGRTSTVEASDSKHDALPNDTSHNHYQRDNETPYHRNEDVPYDRGQDAPYQRDQLKPYKGEKPKVKLTGVHQLSQKKLAQSLIMAEVLGPPRSQKSHRSK